MQFSLTCIGHYLRFLVSCSDESLRKHLKCDVIMLPFFSAVSMLLYTCAVILSIYLILSILYYLSSNFKQQGTLQFIDPYARKSLVNAVELVFIMDSMNTNLTYST